MTTEQNLRKEDADRLYEQHVQPLENVHRGKYVAVSLGGETILAPSLLEAVQRGSQAFGRGRNVVFKVGEKSVGKIR